MEIPFETGTQKETWGAYIGRNGVCIGIHFGSSKKNWTFYFFGMGMGGFVASRCVRFVKFSLVSGFEFQKDKQTNRPPSLSRLLFWRIQTVIDTKTLLLGLEREPL